MRVSYIKGRDPSRWEEDLRSYRLVNLGKVYTSIELKLLARDGAVEKLFVVYPGGDPSAIRVRLHGAEGLQIDMDGRLGVNTELGTVLFTTPVAYQEIDGQRTLVDVAYTLRGGEYGFVVDEFDKSQPLMIDPLLASTFLGGSGKDYAESIVPDGNGNVYVAGWTQASNFPTTSGVYDESFNGNHDLYIAKMDGELTSLIASTFIGGYNVDRSPHVVLDDNGDIYVAGKTFSSDFPTTPGAYDGTFNGSDEDILLVKITGDLSHLVAATFFGGSGDTGGTNIGDTPNSLVLDESGDVWIAGYTDSPDFPTTPNCYDDTHGGDYKDGYVACLSADLSTLLASTLLGGNNEDISWMDLGPNGTVFVAGLTLSSDFPSTPDSYDPIQNGGHDAYVSKFDSGLTTLSASTFLGGSTSDNGYCIAVDESGNVFVGGNTASSDFPTTPGVHDITHNGIYDLFVSKLDHDLTTLVASTFIGGNREEFAEAIMLGGSGGVFLTGGTESWNYPTTLGAYDEEHDGNYDVAWPDTIFFWDAFVSQLDVNLSTLIASTFIGGEKHDYGKTLSTVDTGSIYVGGCTWSVNFPTTWGAYDTYFAPSKDGFVAKFDSLLSMNILTLSWEFSGQEMLLLWTHFPGTWEYWVYGAADNPQFEPGFGPAFEYRLEILGPETNSWISPSGIGDPENNWVYLVMAVGYGEVEVARSNRVGEFDFEGNIP
jgi:hypothetical protein